MSDRAFYGLLAVGTITAAPFMAFGALLALATVNFHDVLHLSVFVAVLLHLHLARRDRRADQRAARQAARAVWRSTVPPPRAAEPRFTGWADEAPADDRASDYARAA